jgi:hypothetical protein
MTILRSLSLSAVLILAAALVAVPAFADRESIDPGRSSESFVAVGVLDLVTHREGVAIFGIGLASGRIEVVCTAQLSGANACDALAERLLGSAVVVRGREFLVNGEHLTFRASSFVRVR